MRASIRTCRLILFTVLFLSLPFAQARPAGAEKPASDESNIAQFCWDMCDGTQDCDTLCNLGGGVSTCGQEGYPCCYSEFAVEQIGARWNTRWGGMWCDEVVIGYPHICRRCPGQAEECAEYEVCGEYEGGEAFGTYCPDLNWGQQYC